MYFLNGPQNKFLYTHYIMQTAYSQYVYLCIYLDFFIRFERDFYKKYRFSHIYAILHKINFRTT